ncbi:MAG: trypsin-like peptidase domain-containing protein, partial [Aquihabitans sp.]
HGSGREDPPDAEGAAVPETSEPAPPDSWDAGAAATTATLPPRGFVWEIPSSTGGDGGGASPVAGAPWPQTPPPHRSGRSFAAIVAAFVVMALVGFLTAGALRSRATTTTAAAPSATVAPAPSATVAPTRPFTSTVPAPSVASGTASSGLSSSDVASIAARVNRGVVNIDTVLGFQGGSAAGTGMVLTSSGEVLTNNHVIQGSTKITVTVVDTGRSYAAHVVGTDPSDDVAVLQIEGASGLKTITAAKSTVTVGDPVVASGNAGGRGGTPTSVAGTVVALGQAITATDENGSNPERLTDLIQVNAAIESGDSGGPLANAAGEVIGMDSAAEVNGTRFRSTSTSGFAIPIAKAFSIVQQIDSGKASSTIHLGLPAFLGVQMAGTPASGNAAGALVAGVERGTPAGTIGLAAGDTITSVNGQAVDSPTRLTTLLHAAHPGDKVAIGWTDQSGSLQTAQATLIAGPAD